MLDTNSVLAALAGQDVQYTLQSDAGTCDINDVTIQETETPVRGSMARGNVYVEESRSYRISGNVHAGIALSLSDTMLGPNPTFGGLTILARHKSGTTRISGSLLSMARTGDTARLSIAVISVMYEKSVR